jgi:hypothetical protein
MVERILRRVAGHGSVRGTLNARELITVHRRPWLSCPDGTAREQTVSHYVE